MGGRGVGDCRVSEFYRESKSKKKSGGGVGVMGSWGRGLQLELVIFFT